MGTDNLVQGWWWGAALLTSLGAQVGAAWLYRLARRERRRVADLLAVGRVTPAQLDVACGAAIARTVRRPLPIYVADRAEDYRRGYAAGRSAGAYAVVGDLVAVMGETVGPAFAAAFAEGADEGAPRVRPLRPASASPVTRTGRAPMPGATGAVVAWLMLGVASTVWAQPVTPAPWLGAVPRQDCATGEWGWVPPSMAPQVTPCVVAPQLPTPPASDVPASGADLMLVGQTYAHPTLGIWRAVAVVVPISGPQRAYYLLESVEPVTARGACGRLHYRPVEAPLGEWLRQADPAIFPSCPNVTAVLP